MVNEMMQRAREQFVLYGPRIVWALVLVIGAWLLGRLISRMVQRVGQASPAYKVVVDLLGQVVRTTTLVIGIICALGTLGVDVSALVASLGLLGFAIGFALKDVLSNVLSGILILYYRPFSLNDQIGVVGKEGVVTNIDLRYTTIVRDQIRILIPNSTLLTNTVEILQTGLNPPAPVTDSSTKGNT